MAQAAKHERLKQAFDTHRTQTEGQIQRLQQVFSLLDLKAEGAPCEAIQGTLAEGSEVMEKFAGRAGALAEIFDHCLRGSIMSTRRCRGSSGSTWDLGCCDADRRLAPAQRRAAGDAESGRTTPSRP